MVLELLGEDPGAVPSRPRTLLASAGVAARLTTLKLRVAVRQRPVWVLAALGAAYGTVAVLSETAPVALGARMQPGCELAVVTGLQVLWLQVLALPLVAGGQHALARESGFELLELSRGVTRRISVAAQTGSSVALAALTLSASSLAILLASVLLWPSRGWRLPVVSFAPGLLQSTPWAWFVLVLAIQVIASASLLTASVALSAFAPPLACSLLPPLVVLALGFTLTGPFWSANPFERISFLQIQGAGWTSPASMCAYWLVVWLGATALALLGVKVTEAGS